MFKITKVLRLRGMFSPTVGRLVLLRSSCSLSKIIYPTVANSQCRSKKKYVGVSQGTNFKSHFSTSRSSLREGDSVIVYHGQLTPQIRMVKLFSLCSSMAGLAAQPILYKHAAELGGTGVLIGVATFVGFFTFVTPVLLHLITKKYVTDLQYNSEADVYTASLLTFFLRVKKVTFKADEVVVPDVPGLFTTFKVKGSSLFVDPRLFDDPQHYGKLMGYDKPIDFLLKKDISSDESEEFKVKVAKDKK